MNKIDMLMIGELFIVGFFSDSILKQVFFDLFLPVAKKTSFFIRNHRKIS